MYFEHLLLCMQHIQTAMYTATAILLIVFAALFAAFCLLVVVPVYFELRKSNIPPGVANPGKLRAIHCAYVGINVVVSVHAVCVAFAGKSNHIGPFLIKFSFPLQTKKRVMTACYAYTVILVFILNVLAQRLF